MRICSRAVEIDPYYAEAWALLALAQCNLRYQFAREIDDGFAAAHAALAIDPAIAEAHLPMFKRLQEQRRFRCGSEEMEAAIRLGPESWSVNKEAGRFYLMRRDPGCGNAALRKSGRDPPWTATSTPGPCSRRLLQALGEKRKSASKPPGRWCPKRSGPSSRIPVTGRHSAFWPAGMPCKVRRKKPEIRIDRACLHRSRQHINMLFHNFACVLAGHLGDSDAANQDAAKRAGGCRGISGSHCRNRYRLRLHPREDSKIPENHQRRRRSGSGSQMASGLFQAGAAFRILI